MVTVPKESYQFGNTVVVPSAGTLQLRGSGNSLAGFRILRAGYLTSASIQVEVVDATRAYNLDIRRNGVSIATVPLAISTLGNAVNVVPFVALAAGDVITAFMVRTSGAGGSTFAEENAVVEISYALS